MAVAALVVASIVAVQARRPAPADAVAVSCVLTVPNRVDVNAPFMSLTASKTCTGADPLDVTWVGWTGTTKVQDLWFLNAGAIELPIYDDDPIGAGQKTIRGQATRYAYSLDRFVPWTGTGGQVQYKEYPSAIDGPWRALYTFTTDASGNFSYSYTARQAGASTAFTPRPPRTSSAMPA